MVGLIGKKVGMTQVFDDTGRLIPVTVLKVEPNVVVAQRTVDRDGYSAVVLGANPQKESRMAKPVLGQFAEGIQPMRDLYEFRDFGRECAVGDTLGLDMMQDVGYVDITGTTKGKGFQGVMKRHNFGGGRKTHGSKFHRANGSTGMAAYPAKVIKGTKMAGRMGGERSTVLSLRVVRIDQENQLILVKGAVPGRKNAVVRIRPAVKRSMIG
ncbi:50S ribosomal protein L3 [Alkalispirochaeta sphaeroplastigenens]|uniref:Large ribosomal subunit protein uL3 n=1 Tax=Alkalispirochaeta sphaeroplastigenens TaxID=1187066 RepID=A0A2S4JGS5_9SPIO|nr:50S ribosomal protein L3 [Alkalispirochaeta sphaeroplastigenens]POQ98757.1 50S ribosomal protein L3 [Alkalispirochaeta sphaeroplastigenens]